MSIIVFCIVRTFASMVLFAQFPLCRKLVLVFHCITVYKQPPHPYIDSTTVLSDADFQRNEMGQSAELTSLVSFSFSKTPPIIIIINVIIHKYVLSPIYFKVLKSISKQLTRKLEQVGVGSSKCTLSSRTESTSSACNDNVT